VPPPVTLSATVRAPPPDEGRPQLLVFTKPARAGRVKTRLIGPLSADEAAALHRAFLGDLLERLLPGPWGVELVWGLAPEEALPDREVVAAELGLAPGALAGVGWGRQVEGDLGQRMEAALAAAARHHPFVAVVGSDHPELGSETVHAVFRRLAAGVPVVLVPAHDGGYVLLGLRAEVVSPQLFAGVVWSSPQVLAATLRNAERCGLATHLLAPAADVDTPADLWSLGQRLLGPWWASGTGVGSDAEPAAGDACPRSARLLRRLRPRLTAPAASS
jgi:rSAM/selenodomain-associated transferase 1